MTLFGSSDAYMGVDIGTSTSKIIELVDKKKRIELVTYAESNLKNLLVHPTSGNDDAINRTADALRKMIERAEIESTLAVAALPSGAVFSTVLTLPNIPESEMENAVRYAARDILPVDINEMVLGWSRVGGESHMQTVVTEENEIKEKKEEEKEGKRIQEEEKSAEQISVFITAAPKEIVNRYIAVFEAVGITLFSLEVETFSLVRSLLASDLTPTLLVDFSARATAFHIIDTGIPRVSHSIDFGGYDITKYLANEVGASESEAETMKQQFGISEKQEKKACAHIMELVRDRQIEKAKDLVALYEKKESKKISKTILIGGGSKLPGLPEYWSKELAMQTTIGNPWKGLSYSAKVEPVLQRVGPRFGVAVGLALRSFAHVP